tara:strand:- start:1164 stop:1520 length:357 start_codon:yes stop_codon:yes gene_type:complete
MDVKVTERAKSRLHDMGVSDDVFLRIGVTSGGCSGNTYDAVLDDAMKEVDDVYYEDGPLRIVSDKVSSVYLDGLTIDFSDDLIEPGFRLTNANAKDSCGCGSSFSTGDAPNVETSFSV